MDVSGQLHAPIIYPEERVLGTHWVGGWVGPCTRDKSLPLLGIEPDSPVTHLVAQSLDVVGKAMPLIGRGGP
jgi:hypothetical protein